MNSIKQFISNPKLIFQSGLVILVFIFIFNPHYLNTDDVLLTWFSSKGLIWNRDFAGFHLPLAHLSTLPFHLIFNWNFVPDLFLGLFVGCITLLLIFYYGQKYLTKIGTSISLIFFSIYYWYFTTGILYINEALIGMLIFAAFFLCQNMVTKQTVTYKDSFLLGILLSLSELSGQISSITILAIILLLVLKLQNIDKWLSLSKKVLVLGVGFLIPFLPLIVYYYYNNALLEFFKWSFLYYFTYANHEKNLSGLPYREILLFYSPLLLIFTISIHDFLKHKKYRPYLFNIIFVSISTIPFIIFSIFHFHHLVYALPILAITAGSVDRTTTNKKTRFFLTSCMWFVIGISLFTFVLPWHISKFKFPPDFTILNDIQKGDDMDQAVNWVKNNTRQDAKIMVFADPLFYVRSNRLPASRPSSSLPFSWEPFEKIKPELIAKPPDYWIIGRDFVRRVVEDYHDKIMVDFINEELRKCYIKRYDTITWQIWQNYCQKND